MSVEELLEKATIQFEKPISQNSIGMYMHYLSYELHANIRYRLTLDKEIWALPEDTSLIPIKTTRFGLSGIITKRTTSYDDYVSEIFNGFSDDPDYIKGVKFDIIPGFDLKEYDPKKIQFWDEIRKLSCDYIKS